MNEHALQLIFGCVILDITKLQNNENKKEENVSGRRRWRRQSRWHGCGLCIVGCSAIAMTNRHYSSFIVS